MATAAQHRKKRRVFFMVLAWAVFTDCRATRQSVKTAHARTMKKTRRFFRCCAAVAIVLCAVVSAQLLQSPAERAAEERLSFQTSGPWSPRTNLNSDVAMVYGIGARMPGNIDTDRKSTRLNSSHLGI